jgi:hypothetical protein
MQSRISTYSSFSSKEVPEFKIFKNLKINILDDIVLKKVEESEYENQKFFSDIVLNGGCPNFPIVYGRGHTFSDDEDKEDYKEECKPLYARVIMAMEKFEGNYDEIDKSKEDIDEYISLLLQILMTLYIIDSYGKYHGDLNPGNLLYKKITREDEAGSDHPGYLKYMIDGEEYYVKHFNKLWVIADFEFMGNKGDVLLSDNGFTDKFFKRLFSDLYEKIEDSSLWDIENSKPLIKGSWMYDIYTFTRFTGALKMSERIFYMMRDNTNIDSPVKAVSHIIKNNFDHLLLRIKP